MDTIKLNAGELEFQAGRLAKVDGMRPQYMDGNRLLVLVNDLASALNSAMDKPQYVAAAFINRMAQFTTPEDEFADPEFEWKSLYASVDEYVSDMSDDRLCGEYSTFMEMVREARRIRDAAAPEPIYLVTYNHDYHESAATFRTRAAAVADIANSFDCESVPDTPGFWQEVMDIYAAGNWKGFQFLTMDPITLAITEVQTNG